MACMEMCNNPINLVYKYSMHCIVCTWKNGLHPYVHPYLCTISVHMVSLLMPVLSTVYVCSQEDCTVIKYSHVAQHSIR